MQISLLFSSWGEFGIDKMTKISHLFAANQSPGAVNIIAEVVDLHIFLID